MRRTATRRKPHQIDLPWPVAEVICPRCRGTKQVYHRATRPHVEVIGGKRIPCPICAASGKVRVPLTALAADPPHTGT
jgi:hypothetical protein